MSDIRWESPPPKKHFGGKAPSPQWVAVAEALRARPGEWALISEDSSASLATHIKTGQSRAFSGGGFEAVSRHIEGTKPMRYRIYARYVGGASA